MKGELETRSAYGVWSITVRNFLVPPIKLMASCGYLRIATICRPYNIYMRLVFLPTSFFTFQKKNHVLL